MARMLDISAESRDGDVPAWLDSERLEELLRASQADPALSDELDALLPDTIADL